MTSKLTKAEARVQMRRRVLLGGWILSGGLLLARAAEVQLLEGEEWGEQARQQQRTSQEVAAPRGAILDRDGAALSVSHEKFRISVAPHEVAGEDSVADRDKAAKLLVEELDLPSSTVEEALSSERRWVVLPGRYPPLVREALVGRRGIYVEREIHRFHPHAGLASGVLGSVLDGHGAGGIEQGFDAILRGEAGQEVQARDNEGRPIPGESFLLRPPRAGGEVVLSIDLELQDIGYEALKKAIDQTGSSAGDLVMTEPKTGEILALVSIRNGSRSGLSATNTPYEPGSTLKPFTVAAILSNGVAALGDSVDTEDGTWDEAGRTLHDSHPLGVITVAEALKLSSNVGVAKVARGLTTAQQYENLRDFGFGVPTGIELPGEAGGILRKPDAWDGQSPASLAIGYEIAVTPIQMAMAYGALANGGLLMEPLLVKEVRTADGEVLQRNRPRKVRRVITRDVARRVSDVLVQAVEEGTGTAARLEALTVAGKTGTTRAYSTSSESYEAGAFFSSFIAFFPADDPRYVIFVKLEKPQGGVYYGGSTAAPVTRETIEAILAAGGAPVDRRVFASAFRRGAETQERGASPRLVSLPPRNVGAGPAEPADRTIDRWPENWAGVLVPDVRGLPLRVAARRLHAVGLRVSSVGPGPVVRMDPGPGAALAPGDTVHVSGSGEGG